jgi:glycosyltransferase involved in cell wall biosynthesis
MKIAIYSHSIAPSIDGVCRRFSGILHELDRLGHKVVLFTLEDAPEDLPPSVEWVTLEYMCIPVYPKKKVGAPTVKNVWRVFNALSKHQPAVLHATADGLSHIFSMCGGLTSVPVVASFHTDLIDLLSTHNANAFQKLLIMTKEYIDSLVMDSCATTSTSFQKKLKNRMGSSCEHVINTAVDLNMFNARKHSKEVREKLTFGNPDGFLCVYTGRISREKRIDLVSLRLCTPNLYLCLYVDLYLSIIFWIVQTPTCPVCLVLVSVPPPHLECLLFSSLSFPLFLSLLVSPPGD